MSNEKHGNTGNQNAAKGDAEKKTGDVFYITSPKGLKSLVIKALNGRKLNPFCRAAIIEKLEKEGHIVDEHLKVD